MIFVLDTNVLWQRREISRLAKVARDRNHRLEMSALVHAERLAQLRRQIPSFDPAFFDEFVRTHDIRVVPFDRAAAEHCASILAGRYVSDQHWSDARRRRCVLRLRVEDPGGRPCPSTVDWFLHPELHGVDAVLVTNDGGAEFEGARAVTLNKAIELAERS